MNPFDFFKKKEEQVNQPITGEPVASSSIPFATEPVPVPLASPEQQTQEKPSEQQPVPEIGISEETPIPSSSAQPPATTAGATTIASALSVPVVVSKTPLRKNIETILSEGLMHVYQTMSLKDQERFRVKGEETATAIEMLVTSLKATGKQLVQLLRAWLLLIPHVNKFFMEQETKIKIDHLLVLQEQKRKEQRVSKFSS